MFEPFSSEVLAELLRQKSNIIDVSKRIELVRSEAVHEPPDATIKLICSSEDSGLIFVTVSGEGNPDLVARAARNIREVRTKLTDYYSGPVLEPLETGVINGRSFAVWPMLLDLPQNRLHRIHLKWRLRPIVFDWLAGVLTDTHIEATRDEKQAIAANLTTLLDDCRHPDVLRQAAENAADRLASGKWTPFHCVQHSDLWMGNIMMGRPGSPASFRVIDWAGATIKGFPFFDLFKFSMSSCASPRLVRKYVKQQLGQLGSKNIDIQSYLSSALGQIQSNLEFFPEDIFRKMAANTIEYSQKFARK